MWPTEDLGKICPALPLNVIPDLALNRVKELGETCAVIVSSAASMNNVNDAAEVLRQRQRWTRRWYLLVIVLLYIGLLASFSLNVSLLLRKPAASVTRTVTSEDGSADSNSATAASVTGDETRGDISDKQGRT